MSMGEAKGVRGSQTQMGVTQSNLQGCGEFGGWVGCVLLLMSTRGTLCRVRWATPVVVEHQHAGLHR